MTIQAYPTAYIVAQHQDQVIHGRVSTVVEGAVLLQNRTWCWNVDIFRLFANEADYLAYIKEYGLR